MSSTAKKKILVADDDKKITMALVVRLKSEGYDVVVAHDGITAIQKACEEQPDLVILDISMPAGNGLHVTDTLRENPRLADIPVILMTAKSNPRYFEEAMERNAVSFLSKPFEENVLVPLVRTSLEYAAC